MSAIKKKIKYKIIPEINTIIEFYYGPIYLNDIKRLKNAISEDEKFDPCFNVIMDGRGSELVTTYKDILNLIDFIKSNRKIVGKRNSAFLTSTPDHVVKTTLLKTLINKLPMNYKICSTLKSATVFAKVSNEDYHIIEETLNTFWQEVK